MSDIFVMLGFYAERPHGNSLSSDEIAKVMDTELSTVRNINVRCDYHEVPRTFFILGDFLSNARDTVPLALLAQVFNPKNLLVDLESHAYSHKALAPISSRPDITVLSPDQLQDELRRTRTLVNHVLGNRPIGLGTPLGYTGGLKHVSYETITTLVQAEIQFVSSDMRDSKGGLNAPLVEDGRLRQPFRYEWTNLWELPTHGWQDTAFTGKSKTLGTEGYPKTIDEMAKHYLEIIRQGADIAKTGEKDIFIGLCWHPWAIAEYDPGLIMMGKFIQGSKELGAKFLSYRGAYEQLRNPANG